MGIVFNFGILKPQGGKQLRQQVKIFLASSLRCEIDVFDHPAVVAPVRGVNQFTLPTQGFRPGLTYAAPSGLDLVALTPSYFCGESSLIRENPCQSVARSYLPLNCACLFSKNADVPSFLSSVARETPNNTASRYKPSARVISMPLFTASMVYWTANGALAIIFCAMASARGMRSAETVTSFTRPMRCASCAVIISPVSTSCMARPLPTRRGRRCVPP